MKIFEFIRRIFWNDKDHINFYSEAIAEGIKAVFEEFGSSMGLDEKS
ncbi:MAG TPA: hypothetical protein VNS50_12720 [Ginsengibacter sp.]|nr:hypothetical protein [Ginsengibacter sp.]